MPGDEKVAFYLRYREHIEEWAALREQAGRELEEALVRAVGSDQEAADRRAIRRFFERARGQR
jgi:hypothetical protein